MTPRRLVVWILGAAIAVALIVTGIIGILTKAR
jgi:quinol-cytochrome oxidoreductase complex cytochrome b subunit